MKDESSPVKQLDAADQAKPVTEEASPLPRTVVYSPETTAAYAKVIETGLRGTADDMLVALRNLATMVHCDFTGELRAPHTHTGSPSINPWRDAIPKCHWGTSCGRLGTKWVSRQVLYCDKHGAEYLPDAPWADLVRSEGL